MALRISHDRRIHEAQIEIPIPCIYLGRAPHQPLRHELDNVLTPGYCSQKSGAGVAVHPRSQQLVNLNDDRIQNDEVAPKLAHQSSSQTMTTVPAIGRGDDGAGIDHDPQSLETSSRR